MSVVIILDLLVLQTSQYYQSLGFSHGGGNDPNVGSSGITKEVPRDNSIIVLPCDHFGDDAPQYSEPSNYGSSDEGSPDEGDNAEIHSMPRVVLHPNLSNKGMVFNDKQHLQSVVKDYSVRHARHEYRVVESTPTKWKIICKQNPSSAIDHCPTSQNCQWWLRVKLGKKSRCWEISRLGPPYSYFMDTDYTSHQNLCKNLLAGDMESLVQVDPTYDVKYVIEHVNSKYNHTISYQKTWQALKRARENVYGTWESSCQFLPKYMGALQRYNPGTIVEWRHKDTVNGVCTLGYEFWAYRPCIEAFKHYCKILTIYGTHLYTKYKHKLLIANTLDANQKVISVAYAIVDDESFRSWHWFLSVHRYCLRHVASNFNSQFKNVRLKDLCYMAGQALSIRNFELVMRQIEGLDRGAHEYLRAIYASKWTFSHDGGYRYGV
ncbi:hypothetical protein ACS0TY_008300 [Phlomoides rotata]